MSKSKRGLSLLVTSSLVIALGVAVIIVGILVFSKTHEVAIFVADMIAGTLSVIIGVNARIKTVQAQELSEAIYQEENSDIIELAPKDQDREEPLLITSHSIVKPELVEDNSVGSNKELVPTEKEDK